MRTLTILILALLPALAGAENPYSELSAPELRTRIAKLPAAEQQSWYQVEVLVFARTGPASQEFWRLDQRPHLVPDNAIHPDSESPLLPEGADNIDNNAAALSAWRFLPADRLILTDMLARMDKSGEYRTLYHNSWVQPVRERSHAFPIYLEGGRQVPAVTLPPADAGGDLEYGLPPLDAPPAGEAHTDDVVAATQAEFQGMLRLHLSRYLHVEPELWFTRTSNTDQRYWVRIDQNRRMRSEELHYLDHPLFGMLLRLTPYQTERQKNVELMKKALKEK